jgi:hypothetical protein
MWNPGRISISMRSTCIRRRLEEAEPDKIHAEALERAELLAFALQAAHFGEGVSVAPRFVRLSRYLDEELRSVVATKDLSRVKLALCEEVAPMSYHVAVARFGLPGVALMDVIFDTTDIQETDDKDPAVLDAVRPALEEAVGKQRALKARLDALQERRPDSRAPTVEEILGLSQDVKARIKDDPIAGRELLRYMLLDGKVTLTPNEDGSYTAASMLIWARVAWKTRKPRGGSGPSGASGDSHEVVGNDGCAGRI